jgi:hypothetical protein
MRERGVGFMYGPPTVENLQALLKAGSHLVTAVEGWVFPLSLRALRRLPAALRVLKEGWRWLGDVGWAAARRWSLIELRGVMLERAHEFGREFDGLFERAARSCRVICVRDREYLSWRYLDAPAQSQTPFALRRAGELVGFAALEISGERASVVDFITIPESDVIDAALQSVLAHAAAARCSFVDLSCASATLLASRLRDQGFWRFSSSGFQVAISSGEAQWPTLLSPTAWNFMMGDTDMDRTITEFR